MVYILHQRLRAQKVAEDKESKVLREVIGAMYSPDFVDVLFQPQAMYTSASTRLIFDKLAHSSLMRLNKSSMDKLYDLMTMSFKHQLLNSTHLLTILHVTMLHLQALRCIIGTDPKEEALRAQLDMAESKLVSLYGPDGRCGSAGQQLLLRTSLMRFVQDRKIKASLFLQMNIQGMDGMFILPTKGALPWGVEVPGRASASLSKTSKLQNYRLTEMPFTAEEVYVSTGPWDPKQQLGTNVYTMDNCVLCARTVEEDRAAAEDCLSRLQLIRRGVAGVNTADAFSTTSAPYKDNLVYGRKLDSSAAKAEQDLTMSLLGKSSASGDAKSTPGMNLASMLSGGIQSLSNSSASSGMFEIDLPDEMVHTLVDARAGAKTLDSMMADLDLKDQASADFKASSFGTGSKRPGITAAAQAKDSSISIGAKSVPVDDEEDDLLALMDQAK